MDYFITYGYSNNYIKEVEQKLNNKPTTNKEIEEHIKLDKVITPNNISIELNCKNKLLTINKELNLHITEIFTTKINLHKYNISYHTLSNYIIDETYIHCVGSMFHNRNWVLGNYHYEICNKLGIVNKYLCKVRGKVFNDQQMVEIT